GHEEPVALGTAKAHIGDDLRQTNPADQLARRGPHGHAIVTDGAAGITRTPQIAVHVAACAVRSAFHPVDHEVSEELLIRDLVVGSDIEDVHVALAARPRVTWALAGADDVELLVVRRE